MRDGYFWQFIFRMQAIKSWSLNKANTTVVGNRFEGLFEKIK